MISGAERKKFCDRIQAASEQIELLQQELSFSKEREEVYRERCLDRKAEVERLNAEIAMHKYHPEVFETEEVIGKKDEQIQVDSDEKLTLRAQIQQMQLEIKEANERTER